MGQRAGVRMGVMWVCAGMLMGAAGPGAKNVENMQKLYDAGKYREAVAEAQRMLAERGVSPEDRHVVMILAAQSHLQLKEPDMAVDVLEAAHKEGVKEDRPRDAAEAEAFALLIPESPGNMYAGRYPILEAEERRKAYGTMFEGRMHHLESMRDAAKRATTLKPVEEIAKDFPSARELEEAAMGEVKQSDAYADEVQKRAGEIVSGKLEEDDKVISRIQADSNINAAGKIEPRKPAGDQR